MGKFNHVTIIGVGLIGGSIGLAIKKRRLAKEVVGVFRRSSTLGKALRRGAVDRGVMSIKDGVEGADLIILATPVSLIPAVAREVIIYAKKGALITDVGSTKKWIVKEIEAMTSALFVGSHPMAGSERAGVESARADLLKGSPCIITRTAATDRAALAKITDFWRMLGAKVAVMSPGAHDRSVSFISHLPHIVAFGLAGSVPMGELKYAAEGFKDTTRVAMSEPELWADIFLTNRLEVLRSGRCFEKYYGKILDAISKNRYTDLVRLLKAAGAKRGKIVHGA
ncbi:MAG: prephenate dehydrogenase/arogenate dehydrogenase family protein [Candidatus Omnitrophica bacterium]|nr:prephenate dehydrogenase/arogenate dehydrogenase family protein [Candidatus Omnitrophota bacterium]